MGDITRPVNIGHVLAVIDGRGRVGGECLGGGAHVGFCGFVGGFKPVRCAASGVAGNGAPEKEEERYKHGQLGLALAFLNLPVGRCKEGAR